MRVVKIDVLDGQGKIDVVVADYFNELRLMKFMTAAEKAFAEVEDLNEKGRIREERGEYN